MYCMFVFMYLCAFTSKYTYVIPVIPLISMYIFFNINVDGYILNDLKWPFMTEMAAMTWISGMTKMTGMAGWLEWPEDQNDRKTKMTRCLEWQDDWNYRMTGMSGWPEWPE